MRTQRHDAPDIQAFCRRRHQTHSDQPRQKPAPRESHGRVVKERDDLMSATRHAVMMLRSAKTVDFYDAMDRDIVYPNLGLY